MFDMMKDLQSFLQDWNWQIITGPVCCLVVKTSELSLLTAEFCANNAQLNILILWAKRAEFCGKQYKFSLALESWVNIPPD